MEAKYLTTTQLTRIINSMTYDAFLPLAVSLETGLRIGDVLKLQPSDVHLDCITYTAQKTGKRGCAPITDTTRRALLENARGTSWCFPSPSRDGNHLTRQAVWKRVKKACIRAGIDPDGISPHSCRKNFAVDVYRRLGAKEAQKALQHSSATVTERYILSDWKSGSQKYAPLLRKDIDMIAKIVFDYVMMAIDNKEDT